MAGAVRSATRARWSNALLLIASMTLALILIEIAFRLCTGIPLLKLANWRIERVVVSRLLDRTVVDPVLGWSVRPHYTSVEHNTLDYGVRRNFHETEIRQGDILAVGDSFTEGWEVDDNESWPAYLEQRLGRPVVNGGIGGYGTDQIILRAEQLVPLVKPKIVIVGFLDFDIVRTAHSQFAAPKPWFDLEGGTLHYHPPAPPEPGRGDGWTTSLKRRSRDVLGYSAAADQVLAHLAPDYWWSEGRGDYKLAGIDAVAVTCALLARLKQELDTQGIRMLLFMQYYAWFVYAADTAPPDARRVLACAGAAGIQTVDHFPSLRAIAVAQPNGLAAYYMTWGNVHTHMNALGNQHAADLLAAALRD